MHSDIYLYLRDRKAAQRYDRKVLQVGVVLVVVGVAAIAFSICYALAMCAVPNFI